MRKDSREIDSGQGGRVKGCLYHESLACAYLQQNGGTDRRYPVKTRLIGRQTLPDRVATVTWPEILANTAEAMGCRGRNVPMLGSARLNLARVGSGGPTGRLRPVGRTNPQVKWKIRPLVSGPTEIKNGGRRPLSDAS
jgi:hypothetical protein